MSGAQSHGAYSSLANLPFRLGGPASRKGLGGDQRRGRLRPVSPQRRIGRFNGRGGLKDVLLGLRHLLSPAGQTALGALQLQTQAGHSGVGTIKGLLRAR